MKKRIGKLYIMFVLFAMLIIPAVRKQEGHLMCLLYLIFSSPLFGFLSVDGSAVRSLYSWCLSTPEEEIQLQLKTLREQLASIEGSAKSSTEPSES